MSDYQGSDTFLSRVFGLHSVYNQINDNYHYYDDEEEQSRLAYAAPGRAKGNPNILDLESDLESESVIESNNDDMINANRNSHPLIPNIQTSNRDLGNYFEDIDPNQSMPYPDFNNNNSNNNNNNINKLGNSLINPNPILNANKAFSRASVEPTPQIGAVAFELPLYNKRTQKPDSNKPTIHAVYQRQNRKSVTIPPKERALYLWANITNMDEFLQDIYYYYRAKGYINIVLNRLIDLVILAFLLGFTIFLKYYINYDLFLNRNNPNFPRHPVTLPLTLSDLILENPKIPHLVNFLLFGFSCYIILRLVQLYLDMRYKLKEISNFYCYLLNIKDDTELMTILWSTIVERLMLLKDYNGLTTTNDPHYLNDLSSKVRLNAHDIANRIMRKENYLIGLVNKNILNFNFNFPFTNFTVNTLLKTLEWNLQLCINNFVFDRHGQINPSILKEVNRNKLAAELKSRFQMAAIINLIISPFIVTYFVLLYFFRYFNEYKQNPGSIVGIRQYTPLAEWKLREFNELQHFFLKRLQLSIGPANTYINQFPRGVFVVNFLKLLNFICGSFVAALVIFGLFLDDEEHNFWSFELTESRSTLFYISIFGTIWAITNNSIEGEPAATSSAGGVGDTNGTFFYDPEASLRYVSQFTHYLPTSWNGRLHLVDVKNEFCDLYSLKIVVILNELMSLILTPFILWFKISNLLSLVIDFYREYSIHVDGLGYVCYFAMFNFEEKDKNMMFDLNKRKKKRSIPKKKPSKMNKSKKTDQNASDTSDSDDSEEDVSYDSFKNEKMIKSYMYFLESYDDKSKMKTKKNATSLNTMKPKSYNKSNNLTSTSRNNQAVLRHSGTGPSSDLISAQNLDQSMAESMYHINYNFEENDEPGNHKPGVLGMLNQFYKQST